MEELETLQARVKEVRGALTKLHPGWDSKTVTKQERGRTVSVTVTLSVGGKVRDGVAALVPWSDPLSEEAVDLSLQVARMKAFLRAFEEFQ